MNAVRSPSLLCTWFALEGNQSWEKVLGFSDKTPDELTRARLQPSACEKTYEDKGYRWAAEMGVLRSVSKTRSQ